MESVPFQSNSFVEFLFKVSYKQYMEEIFIQKERQIYYYPF